RVHRMSRHKTVPSYRLHKQSGQAVVTLPDGLGGRRDALLGKYGTAESRAEYLRALAEWEANGRRLLQPPAAARTASPMTGCRLSAPRSEEASRRVQALSLGQGEVEAVGPGAPGMESAAPPRTGQGHEIVRTWVLLSCGKSRTLGGT